MFNEMMKTVLGNDEENKEQQAATTAQRPSDPFEEMNKAMMEGIKMIETFEKEIEGAMKEDTGAESNGNVKFEDVTNKENSYAQQAENTADKENEGNQADAQKQEEYTK